MSTYCVFDLDGTLTISSRQISTEMLCTLQQLKNKNIKNVIVSGGTYDKILWQIANRYDLFDMIFAESGAVLYQDNKQIFCKNIANMINPILLQNLKVKFIQICDQYKFQYQGERFDIRNGLIYATISGMMADDYTRKLVIDYDQQHNIRYDIINELRQLDSDDSLEIVKGGKTGLSIYPKGMDKTQILPYLANYKIIHFYGDSCKPDGNDYCLYSHPLCVGHAVQDYHHTIKLLTDFM